MHYHYTRTYQFYVKARPPGSPKKLKLSTTISSTSMKQLQLSVKGAHVLGSQTKGRTAAAALFLGSLAEKMVNDKMNHPLLVIRFKGRNAGLLETLREI